MRHQELSSIRLSGRIVGSYYWAKYTPSDGPSKLDKKKLIKILVFARF